MIQIKKILDDIVDYAYKDNPKLSQYKSFSVVIVEKMYKSKHGDYDIISKQIRIFNPHRPDAAIVSTLIHELAHHIDNMNRGDSDHSEAFYKEYKTLLYAALDMGVLNKEQVLENERDATDSLKVKAMISDYEPKASDYKESGRVIVVKNCFHKKESLKARGYKYNGMNKSWDKEISIDALDEEMNYLTEQSLKFEVFNKGHISFDKKIFILAGKGSYEKKDKLKELGFRWLNADRVWGLEVNYNEAKDKIFELKEMLPDIEFNLSKY